MVDLRRVLPSLVLVLLLPTAHALRTQQNASCGDQPRVQDSTARIRVLHPEGHRVELLDSNSSVTVQVVICGDFCRRGCEFREIPQEEWEEFDGSPSVQIFHGSTVPEYLEDGQQYLQIQSSAVKLFEVLANVSETESSGTLLELQFLPQLPESLPLHQETEICHQLNVLLQRGDETWSAESAFFWSAPRIRQKAVLMYVSLDAPPSLSRRCKSPPPGPWGPSDLLGHYPVLCREIRSETVKQLFSDLKNVVPFLIKDEYQIMKTRESVFQEGNIEFLRGVSFAEIMYRHAGVEYSMR
eukprot:44687-Hanusia_phi.AAC.1